MDVTIRPVTTLAQLEEALDVAGHETAGSIDHTNWRFATHLERFPADTDLDFVAESGGEPIGAVIGRRRPDGTAVASLLGVRKEYRGAGVGSRLMEALWGAAEQSGCPRVTLGAEADAEAFYQRTGWTHFLTAAEGGQHIYERWLRPHDVVEVDSFEVPWAVERLRRRRQTLQPHAPVYWRPAVDQQRVHGDYLRQQLDAGQARAWRTKDSVVVALRSRDGWVLDDMAVEDWECDGEALWSTLSRALSGTLELVSPVYEPERQAWGERHGLLAERTWWLREIDPTARAPRPSGSAAVREAAAPSGTELVTAPPVYVPGGPLLFVADLSACLDSPLDLVSAARDRGCAGLVVAVVPGDDTSALAGAGLREHCRFLRGPLPPPADCRSASDGMAL